MSEKMSSFEDVSREPQKFMSEEEIKQSEEREVMYTSIEKGKEEEILNTIEKLKNKGGAENLSTFIRLHKEVILPIDSPILAKEGFDENTFKDVIGMTSVDSNEDAIYFIDNKCNFCKVNIDRDEILDMKELGKTDIENKLRELGFIPYCDANYKARAGFNSLVSWLKPHREYLEEKAISNKANNFDF